MGGETGGPGAAGIGSFAHLPKTPSTFWGAARDVLGSPLTLPVDCPSRLWQCSRPPSGLSFALLFSTLSLSAQWLMVAAVSQTANTACRRIVKRGGGW